MAEDKCRAWIADCVTVRSSQVEIPQEIVLDYRQAARKNHLLEKNEAYLYWPKKRE